MTENNLEPVINKLADNIINSLDTLKKVVLIMDIPELNEILDSIDNSINEIDLFKAFYEIYK